jgi:hypothetical protein
MELDGEAPMSVPVRDFLKHRRDRALGTILGYLEREVFARLQPAERESVRRVVLDAINGYHDSVLDLVKAEDASSVRNEEVLRVLSSLERKFDARSRTPI